MFEQSLMESAAVARSHRGLATSISALVQLTALAIAILSPMVFTQTLPLLRSHAVAPIILLSVTPPEPEPTPTPGERSRLTSAAPTLAVNNPFPVTHPIALQHAASDPPIPQFSGPQSNDVSNIPLGAFTPNSNIRGPSRPLVVSNLSEGRIIRRVMPEYPLLAKLARVEGQVIIEATISRSGAIQNLRVLSGHHSLARAAESAVSQWQFRPYILNGTPIDVVTQITFDFKLNRE
ncbi:MAG: energy transducer TonB [Acidobacteriales bacterium]|nr:energy transducer TonB [Terriglobales bacterium]